MSSVIKISACAVAMLALSASATTVLAAGCNGVVNPAVWGCAPWDNNNGPQYPNYRKAAAPAPSAPAYVARPSAPQVMPGNGNGIVASGAGNIVASGAGNIVASGAGNMRNGGH